MINSEKNDQAQEESAASLVNSAQTDETVKVKSRKKFDFVVLMFLVLAGIGVALVIVVLNGLRIEVRRASEAMQKYKKKEKQKLFQNIEE